jgi:methylmalonyl-CoA/ethylmalonyl-CoA epimerase
MPSPEESTDGMRLDHVGIATDDAHGLAELLGGLLNAAVVHEETFDGLELVFLDVGEADIELVEPLDDDGPVARFLDRRGPGLHHLAFEVPDVGSALDAAEAMGLERIDEAPRPGARGHTVAFLHPRSTGGVLVEFVAH